MEEKLLSIQPNITVVPESYVLPPESRLGGNYTDYRGDSVPVIDLGKLHVAADHRARIIQEIVEASQQCGFFQVINHGVSEELMESVMKVGEGLFELPMEEKAKIYSEDRRQSCRLYPSIDYDNEKVHFWRDTLRFPCHPLQDHIQSWPSNPPHFREVVGEYSERTTTLMWLLLDLIYEGLLGTVENKGYSSSGFQSEPSMAINHYPRCPDPSLTLGLPPHSDPGILTLLLQGQVNGLQLFKDGEWVPVQPLPSAFVINIGHSLQIMSNGRVKSGHHRVGTNAKAARTTVATFINPSLDCRIEPSEAFLDSSSSQSQMYKPFTYRDFLLNYVTATHDMTDPLELYKL